MGTDEFEMEEFEESYFWWLVDLADDGSGYIYDYSLLLRRLFETEFKFANDLDDNRRFDGLDLRLKFENKNRKTGLKEDDPCSILEMMVALACRCDHDIMGEPGENRSFVWFWVMMDNAGWSDLTDNVVDADPDVLDDLFFNPENPVSGFQKQDLGDLFWPTKRPVLGDIWAKMNQFLVENPEIG